MLPIKDSPPVFTVRLHLDGSRIAFALSIAPGISPWRAVMAAAEQELPSAVSVVP